MWPAVIMLCVCWGAAELIDVEEQHQNKKHWYKVGRPNKHEEHEMIFAMRQYNLERLEAELMAVSTPGGPRYGKYLEFDEVDQFISTKATAKQVLQWVFANIQGARVTKTTTRGEYVRVRASVAAIEKALHTTFHYWKSDDVGKVVLRCTKYRLPKQVAAQISTIFRTTDFPPLLKPLPRSLGSMGRNRTISQKAPASNLITPAVLNSFYQITSNTGSGQVSQAVFETSGQTYSPQDLSTFQGHFGLPTEAVAKDVGGHSSGLTCELNPNSCTEANLDVQYMMAISRTTPMTYFYEGNEEDPFVAFAEAIAAEKSPPLVNSISYGSMESEIASSTMEAFNTEVMKLGTMGVSVLVSSGDDGVANFQVQSKSQCAYNPSYPATCPYVTAVGATYAQSWAVPGKGEVVCQSNVDNAVITSGGGFSTLFAAPTYQQAAIKSYFENVATQPKRGYSKTGRGYPDVALSGFGYEVVIADSLYTVCGTSCSAPSVAGMVSLVNAIRQEAGAAPLGFLNPMIYQHASVFNDVTQGENQCTANAQVCCEQGFHAASGWDPTTGFGSVDYSKFKAAFTADLDKATVKASEARLAAKVARPQNDQNELVVV